MIELGQLERRHEDFTRRNTRIVAVSVETTDDARKTQADFPHLLVLADEGRGLTDALALVHARAAPDGSDIATPTTIIVDRGGIVRWLYRTPGVAARLSPDEVVEALDRALPASH